MGTIIIVLLAALLVYQIKICKNLSALVKALR